MKNFDNNHFPAPYTILFYHHPYQTFNTIGEIRSYLENKPELQKDMDTVIDSDNHIFAFDYLGLINRKKFQLDSKRFTFD